LPGGVGAGGEKPPATRLISPFRKHSEALSLMVIEKLGRDVKE